MAVGTQQCHLVVNKNILYFDTIRIQNLETIENVL
jgi:hypothetical protein